LTSEYAKQHPRKDAPWRLTYCETARRLLLRCSRPLCSSQQTARTPTPTNPQVGFGEGLRKTSTPHPKAQDRPVPQDPTACTCRPPPTTPFQPRKRGVLSTAEINRHLCQCSTHEQPAGRIGPDLVNTAKTRGPPSCSLERR